MVTEAVSEINGSQYLVDQLIDLQAKHWEIEPTASGTSGNISGAGGDPYLIPGVIFLNPYNNGNGFSPNNGSMQVSVDVASNLVGTLSYEIGHAEDLQLNTFLYGGNDLALGAAVAESLFSEGKSLLNNAIASEEIYQTLTTNNVVPILAPYDQALLDYLELNFPQAIINGAISTGLQGGFNNGVASGGVDLLANYWDEFSTYATTSIASTSPYQIHDAISEINITQADQLTFSNNADGSDSMTLGFIGGSVSAYVIDFGGYEELAPSDTIGGQDNVNYTYTASPTTLITYQEFTFKNGDLLKEEYIFNSGTMIAGTQASETLIGAGTLAGLQAGGSLDTLIDITGTNSTFENVNQKSVTEEALNGTASTKNVFKFGGGTNVLIGDIGHNTFVENLSASNAVNIIYGGGGVSTYELSGLIDILYTETTPTAQQIEDLSLKQLSATIPSGVGSYGDTTYIIDPNVKDVLELPSYQPGSNYVPGEGFPEYYQGTPTYSSVAGNYYPTLQSAIGSYYGVQNGNDAAFANFVYLKKDHYPANYDIVGQPYNNGDGIIGPFLGAEIVNGYLPGGFGDNMLEDTSKKSDEVFITLGTSSSSAITMSSAPSMAILHPSSVTVANPSPWAPDMASGYLHRSAYQMEVLGSEKTPTALGSPAIDLIASTTKWMPTITIQVSGS